jgi:hypothetical protein
VPLRAQFAQHLHPLHVRPVPIGMRHHFVYHQNVQRPGSSVTAGVANVFVCTPFIHRDCHRDMLSGSVLRDRNAHSCASICASNQAIALPIAHMRKE